MPEKAFFDNKCITYSPKVGLKCSFLPFEFHLLSKKPEAKSKYFSERLFSEIFRKSFLLGVLTNIQCTQKRYRLDGH